MIKKAFAVIALAVLAVFAVPAAANAAGYVPSDSISVSGQQVAGSTVKVSFGAGSFTAGETVSFTVTGDGFNYSASATAKANGSVSFNVKLPKGATGSYTVNAVGGTSGNVGTTTITVATPDKGGLANTGDNLANTGYDAPVLLIWSAAGALLLGAALVVVMTIVRRQRATA